MEITLCVCNDIVCPKIIYLILYFRIVVPRVPKYNSSTTIVSIFTWWHVKT